VNIVFLKRGFLFLFRVARAFMIFAKMESFCSTLSCGLSVVLVFVWEGSVSLS
jgi:hypothetical protein